MKSKNEIIDKMIEVIDSVPDMFRDSPPQVIHERLQCLAWCCEVDVSANTLDDVVEQLKAQKDSQSCPPST